MTKLHLLEGVDAAVRKIELNYPTLIERYGADGGLRKIYSETEKSVRAGPRGADWLFPLEPS